MGREEAQSIQLVLSIQRDTNTKLECTINGGVITAAQTSHGEINNAIHPGCKCLKIAFPAHQRSGDGDGNMESSVNPLVQFVTTTTTTIENTEKRHEENINQIPFVLSSTEDSCKSVVIMKQNDKTEKKSGKNVNPMPFVSSPMKDTSKSVDVLKQNLTPRITEFHELSQKDTSVNIIEGRPMYVYGKQYFTLVEEDESVLQELVVSEMDESITKDTEMSGDVEPISHGQKGVDEAYQEIALDNLTVLSRTHTPNESGYEAQRDMVNTSNTNQTQLISYDAQEKSLGVEILTNQACQNTQNEHSTEIDHDTVETKMDDDTVESEGDMEGNSQSCILEIPASSIKSENCTSDSEDVITSPSENENVNRRPCRKRKSNSKYQDFIPSFSASQEKRRKTAKIQSCLNKQKTRHKKKTLLTVTKSEEYQLISKVKHGDVDSYVCHLCGFHLPFAESVHEHLKQAHPQRKEIIASEEFASDVFNEKFMSLAAKYLILTPLERNVNQLKNSDCNLHENKPLSEGVTTESEIATGVTGEDCELSEDVLMAFILHHFQETENDFYECQLCGKRMKRDGYALQDWVGHLNRHNLNPRRTTCLLCMEFFPQTYLFYHHMHSVHNKHITTGKFTAAAWHLNDRTYSCHVCETLNEFQTLVGYEKHMLKEHSVYPVFPCVKSEACKVIAASESELEDHECSEVRVKGSEVGTIEVQEMERMIETEIEMTEYGSSEGQKGPTEQQKVQDRAKATERQSIKTETKIEYKEVCELCGFQSSGRNGIRRHQQLNCPAMMMTTDSTAKTATTAKTDTTAKTATAPKADTKAPSSSLSSFSPFAAPLLLRCPYAGCGAETYGSRAADALRCHVNKVHLKRWRHTCSTCGKEFADRSALRQHTRTVHEGRRDFACSWPQCGRSFLRRNALAVHYRKHTGARNLLCEYCSYGAYQRAALDYHMKRHHSDKPYSKGSRGGGQAKVT